MAEHTEYREWLDLQVEGELPAAESRRLEDHLESCSECRGERHRLLRLRRALEEVRIPVREDFRASVMASLPEPARQHRAAASAASATRRSFAWAAGLLVALAATAGILFAAAGGALAGAPGAGIVVALVKMTGAALVTGAGLLGASWSGVGLAVGEMFASAPGTLVAFALLLLFLGGLVVALLRRPSAARQRTRD